MCNGGAGVGAQGRRRAAPPSIAGLQSQGVAGGSIVTDVDTGRRGWKKPEVRGQGNPCTNAITRPLSLGSGCDLHRLFGLAQKVFGALSHPSPDGVPFLVAFRFQDCCLFARSGRGMANVPPFEHLSMYFNSLV